MDNSDFRLNLQEVGSCQNSETEVESSRLPYRPKPTLVNHKRIKRARSFTSMGEVRKRVNDASPRHDTDIILGGKSHTMRKKRLASRIPKKEKVPRDCVYFPKGQTPRFFPLTSLRLGNWQSQLHIQDQLFLYITETKFVFVAVHP